MKLALTDLLNKASEEFEDDVDFWKTTGRVMDLIIPKTPKLMLKDISKLVTGRYCGIFEDSVRLLYPTLIYKQLIDAFIIDLENDNEHSVGLKKSMKTLCKSLYTYKDSDANDVVESIEDSLKYLPFKFYDKPMTAICDSASWEWSNPVFLGDTVEAISDKLKDSYNVFNNSGIYFIHTGNGGILPGLSIEAMLESELKTMLGISVPIDSYVVRLSAHKKDDKSPRFTQYEIDMIRDESNDKQVIIFEEDVYTGRAMRILCETYVHELKRDDILFSCVGMRHPFNVTTGYCESAGIHSLDAVKK
ncbi:hypothetical protein JXM83_00770 [Candidatus Woesearchaeota archaeon]|nr:hypothetical protein [Candidatus Woesearchaeota archaeon]